MAEEKVAGPDWSKPIPPLY